MSICIVIALASAQTVWAQFSASFTMTSGVPDPAHVYPLTPITITVWDTQGYGTTIYDNAISRIQLNWTNSSAGLGLTTVSTWTWGAALAGLVDYVDSDMSDGIVGRINAGSGIVPGTSFSVGTLAFNAPAYNSGGGNTHGLTLGGGTQTEYDLETLTVVACGSPSPVPGEPGGVQLLDFPPDGTGLTLSGYNITVVPGGYWTGATNTQWQTGTNWSSQMTPDGTFEAVFDGAPTGNQPALTKDEAVKSVDFRTGGWTVGGSAYKLSVGSGGITSTGAASTTNTIQPTVELTADAAITVVGATHTLQLGAISASGRTLGKEGIGRLTAANVAAGIINVNAGSMFAGAVTANKLNVNSGPVQITSLTGSGADLEANIAASKTLTVTGPAGMTSLNLVAVEGALAAGDNPVTTTLTGAVRVGMAAPTASLYAGDVTANVFNLNKGSASVKNLYGTGTGSTATLAAGTAFTMRSSSITGWNTLNANTNVTANTVSAGTVAIGSGASFAAGAVTANNFMVNSGSATMTTLTGANPATSTVSVAAGKTLGVYNNILNVDQNILNVNTLTVDGKATLHSLSTESTPNETSIVRSLVMNKDGGGVPLGTLDLKTGNLVVDYTGASSPLVEVANLVKSGANFDPKTGNLRWNGTGITSSSIPSGPDPMLYAVGVREAVDAGSFAMADLTNLEGVTLGSKAVVAKYTWIGDVNLDGKVTQDDYDVMDYYQVFGTDGEPFGAGWWTGDLNGNGVTTQDDYDLADYGQVFQNGSTLGRAQSMLSTAPEPATMCLMGLGLAAMAVRRRRAAK